MHAHRTVALLALATAPVAGSGIAAATDAPPAVQAENTTVEYSGDAVTLVTGSSATVTGGTGLEPGTNLTVVVRSSDECPFLVTNETTVREDGRFAATFDLTEMPDGANATVSVRSDGEELVEAPVRLVTEPTPTPTASPTPDPTSVPTDSPIPSNTSSGNGPGVGGLVALFAVLGTAFVVSRRA